MLDRRVFLSLLSVYATPNLLRASDFEAFKLRIYFEEGESFFARLFDYLIKFADFKPYGLKLLRVPTLEEADCALISFPNLLRKNTLNFNFVMNLVERPSLDFISRRSKGVALDLTGLEDKTIAYVTGDVRFERFKQLLELKGVKSDTLKFEAVGRHVLEPLLASGEVDAILGESYRNLTGLKARGVPLEDLFSVNFQDQGFHLYGLGLAASQKAIADFGDKIKAFLTGLFKLLVDLRLDLKPLIEAEMSKNGQLVASLLQEEFLSYYSDNLFTPAVITNGFGVYTRERFEKSLKQLGLGGKYEFDSLINTALLPPLTP